MSKTFTVAGVSAPRGQMAVQWRFANGAAAARTKVLVKNGDSAIALYDLPNPMTKDAAIDYVTANFLGKTPAAPAVKAEAKAAVKAPGVRAEKRQAKAEAASKAKDEAKEIAKRVEAAQKSVTRNEIDADIDESDIPEFIKRDFRRA